MCICKTLKGLQCKNKATGLSKLLHDTTPFDHKNNLKDVLDN